MEKRNLCEKCMKNPDLESCSRKEKFDIYFCCIRKKNHCFECLVSELLDRRKELMKYVCEMKQVDQELDVLHGMKRTYE